jgi:hypothetical protein
MCGRVRSVAQQTETKTLCKVFLCKDLCKWCFNWTSGWRKLHDEELHNFYSSPSIIRMIKSRNMRWAGHIARMRDKRNAYRILVGKPERKSPLGNLDIGGRIILNCILEKTGWGGLDWIDLAQDRDQCRLL